MPTSIKINPNGNINERMTIHSSADLGAIVRERRRQLALTQADVAGVGGTGNRFIVDLENGKPTVQLQKTLHIMNLLGLEVIIRAKGTGSI
jgi:HTH-type transcriptional regulator/antitoxin HipB